MLFIEILFILCCYSILPSISLNGNDKIRIVTQTRCLDEKKYDLHTKSDLHLKSLDQSWIEYCHEVYGDIENPLSIDKSTINFYYINTNIKIITINWNQKSKPLLYWTGYERTYPYVYGYKSNIIYPDHNWVEVSRFSSKFYQWNILNITGDSYYRNKEYEGEGYSAGTII